MFPPPALQVARSPAIQPAAAVQWGLWLPSLGSAEVRVHPCGSCVMTIVSCRVATRRHAAWLTEHVPGICRWRCGPHYQGCRGLLCCVATSEDTLSNQTLHQYPVARPSRPQAGKPFEVPRFGRPSPHRSKFQIATGISASIHKRRRAPAQAGRTPPRRQPAPFQQSVSVDHGSKDRHAGAGGMPGS